jgi:hypothetical protein
LKLWNHALGGFENLKLVLQLSEGAFVILQLFILLLNESLLVSDVFLDLVKEQVNSLLLVLFDSLELGEESLDVFWWGNSDKVSLALVQQVLELAFGVLTAFNLHGIRETIRNFLLVKVDELGQTNVAKFVHYIPGIINMYCQLIEPHLLGSNKMAKNLKYIYYLLTYKSPFFINI